MRVLYIALFCGLTATAAAQADPDALYRERATPGRAEAAVEVWAAQLAANPQDFDAAWKIARATYWIGTHGPAANRRAALERGVAAAKQAAMLMPGRSEGHFWNAANMGALAESFGMRQGLRYRGPIRQELETTLRLDPAFLQGSADRALGRWYHKVPGLFGGDKRKAEQHLRKSLTYNPDSAASRFFLAETLFELDRDKEAMDELRAVIAGPLDPEWTPEDLDFKEQAKRLLATRAAR
jgi:tetratricopeptide (TPR) repeat protein